MLVLQVAFHIKPERLDDFLKAMLENSSSAVRDEPGCLLFDVIQDMDDPNRIYLYEVYRDQAALDYHRQAPHYLKWRDTVQEWHAEPGVRHLGRNLFPTDADWR